MLVCQQYFEQQADLSFQQDFDWSTPAQAYTNLEEMPSFIEHCRQSADQRTFCITADPPVSPSQAAPDLQPGSGALQQQQPTTTVANCLRYSWCWQVLPDTLPETASGG